LGGAITATGLQPTQPAAREPVPAVVSPDLASQAQSDGELPLDLVVGPSVRLKVVGVADHFPATADGPFAITDLARLYADLNTKSPGAAAPNEVWLKLRRGSSEDRVVRLLDQPPFRPLSIISRNGLRRERARDPISQGSVWALLVASALGLALGATGVGLLVASELHDGRGELRDLEALGLTPRELRRQVRLRAVLAATLALAFGLAGGVALTHLFTGLVALAANGTDPTPPLVAVDPWAQVAAALALIALALAAVIAAQTHSAFRGDSVGRLNV
jgi:hypothetical protein